MNTNDSYAWMRSLSIFTKAPKLLSYILPIEFFFGRNDVYLCDGIYPLTIYRSKKILLVHDLMVRSHPEYYSFIRRAYLRIFFAHLRRADLVITVSESTKYDIVKYYKVPAEKIVVCNCAAADSSIIEGRRPSIIEESARYLLYVGDMRRNKNVVRMVAAFLKLCKDEKIRDFKLVIAGKKSGDYEAARHLAMASVYTEQVVFLGYVTESEKRYLYDNCSAVVLVSTYEGFGMPIVEGIAAKKPIITSNCSSMKEIGQGIATFVDPESIDSITQAMRRAYMGECEVDHAEYTRRLRKYSFDSVSDIIDAAILDCIS